MRQAVSIPSTKLSHLIRDPMVARAFRHAEQDLGDDYAAMVTVDHPRRLDGGAAAILTCGARRVPILEVA